MWNCDRSIDRQRRADRCGEVVGSCDDRAEDWNAEGPGHSDRLLCVLRTLSSIGRDDDRGVGFAKWRCRCWPCACGTVEESDAILRLDRVERCGDVEVFERAWGGHDLHAGGVPLDRFVGCLFGSPVGRLDQIGQ
nr:hypothetical protein [Salinarchaeum laminariae]